MRKCVCGCGQFANEGRRFVCGHSNKGKNNPFFGKHHPPNTKRLLSDLKIGKHLWIKRRHPMLGKHPSKETKEKMSKSKSGKNNFWFGKKRTDMRGKNNPMYKKKVILFFQKRMSGKGNPMYGKTGKNNPAFGKENKWGHHTKEAKKKMSQLKKGKNHPMWGKHHSKERKEKIGTGCIVWFKKHPEFGEQQRERNIKMLKKGFHPSKFEKRIMKIIRQNHLPWKYVGDGREGSFFGKVPDFINTNGQKTFAEAYEDRYWHDKNYTKTRRKHFAKFGFKTKFINYYDGDKKIISILSRGNV